MKKRKLISFITILLTLALILTGCYGLNGNPNELTGKWGYTRETRDTFGAHKNEYTMEIKNDGTFIFIDKYIGSNSNDDYVLTRTGNIVGNVTDSPKNFTFHQTNFNRVYGEASTKIDENEALEESIIVEYELYYHNGKTQMAISYVSSSLEYGLFTKE